ncbi:hypothetical protein NQ024_13070, partial [Corynebacterium sp. 35RC1]|nr:hypothetical protein [Corynebacterium sp. 35RC1]
VLVRYAGCWSVEEDTASVEVLSRIGTVVTGKGTGAGWRRKTAPVVVRQVRSEAHVRLLDTHER